MFLYFWWFDSFGPAIHSCMASIWLRSQTYCCAIGKEDKILLCSVQGGGWDIYIYMTFAERLRMDTRSSARTLALCPVCLSKPSAGTDPKLSRRGKDCPRRLYRLLAPRSCGRYPSMLPQSLGTTPRIAATDCSLVKLGSVGATLAFSQGTLDALLVSLMFHLQQRLLHFE